MKVQFWPEWSWSQTSVNHTYYCHMFVQILLYHLVSPFRIVSIVPNNILLMWNLSLPAYTDSYTQPDLRCWRVGSSSPVPQLQQLKPTPSTETASMAAKHFYRQGFLLLLFNFISTAALEKRFSDLKRCADEECSSKYFFWGGLFWWVFSPGLHGCISVLLPLHPDTTDNHKLCPYLLTCCRSIRAGK